MNDYASYDLLSYCTTSNQGVICTQLMNQLKQRGNSVMPANPLFTWHAPVYPFLNLVSL